MTTAPVVARRYRIAALLSKGSTGRIYRAVREEPDGQESDVAVKLLRDEDVATLGLKRLRDEAARLALVKDRAIVQVEPPVQLDGKWALVMDLVTGASVQRLTSLGAMPTTVAAEIVQEVARALDKLWNGPAPDGRPLRILHRDLKPSNLHVNAGGEVRILDYGIAKADYRTRDGQTTLYASGNRGFIAPERLELERPDADDGPAGDVFSLGVTAHVLVTGDRPNRRGSDEDEPETVQADSASQAMIALVARMRSADPLDRPTAKEVEEQCARIRRRGAGQTLREWAERNVPRAIAVRFSDDVVGSVLTEASPARRAESRAPAPSRDADPRRDTSSGRGADRRAESREIREPDRGRSPSRAPERAERGERGKDREREKPEPADPGDRSERPQPRRESPSPARRGADRAERDTSSRAPTSRAPGRADSISPESRSAEGRAPASRAPESRGSASSASRAPASRAPTSRAPDSLPPIGRAMEPIEAPPKATKATPATEVRSRGASPPSGEIKLPKGFGGFGGTFDGPMPLHGGKRDDDDTIIGSRDSYLPEDILDDGRITGKRPKKDKDKDGARDKDKDKDKKATPATAPPLTFESKPVGGVPTTRPAPPRRPLSAMTETEQAQPELARTMAATVARLVGVLASMGVAGFGAAAVAVLVIGFAVWALWPSNEDAYEGLPGDGQGAHRTGPVVVTMNTAGVAVPGEDLPLPPPPVRLEQYLTFSSIPLGADVLIDGEHLGQTPLVGVTVRDGPHEVTLVSDAERVVRQIEVGKKKPTRYVWRGGDQWEQHN